MLNWMVMFTFSLSARKYPFWANMLYLLEISFFEVKFSDVTNTNMWNLMMFIFSYFGLKILSWKKLIPNYQNYYKFLFKLLNLIMSSFCFEKSIKIPANASPLPSFLLRSNTEWHCTKKWSFPLWIFSVNVTKSAGNRGFCHIYWRNH